MITPKITYLRTSLMISVYILNKYIMSVFSIKYDIVAKPYETDTNY